MNFLITGKIKIMKAIYYILILTTFISCVGTDQGEVVYWNYKIINNSGIAVELIPYYNGVKNKDKKINLTNNKFSELNIKSVPPLYGSIKMSDFFYYPDLGRLSQVEIVFNNTKKVIYDTCFETSNCNALSRNLFNEIFNDTKTEIYTITPEDYQNAIDCGGNCN